MTIYKEWQGTTEGRIRYFYEPGTVGESGMDVYDGAEVCTDRLDESLHEAVMEELSDVPGPVSSHARGRARRAGA